eukprot:1148896-Rhodomonas_salina.1
MNTVSDLQMWKAHLISRSTNGKKVEVRVHAVANHRGRRVAKKDSTAGEGKEDDATRQGLSSNGSMQRGEYRA